MHLLLSTSLCLADNHQQAIASLVNHNPINNNIISIIINGHFLVCLCINLMMCLAHYNGSHEQQHQCYSSSSNNHVDPLNGINLVTQMPMTNLPKPSSSSLTWRNLMCCITGFLLTTLCTTLQTTMGWSLTALYASTIATMGAWLQWIVKMILAPFPPWMRYFVQPFLVAYYVPLFVLHNLTGPSTHRRVQQTHEKVLEDGNKLWHKLIKHLRIGPFMCMWICLPPISF